MWKIALRTSVCLLAGTVAAVAIARPASTASTASTGGLDGSWRGTYTQIRPAELAVAVSGGEALVALGAGHATVRRVKASVSSGRLRLIVPGLPSPVVLEARRVGDRLVGTATQGKVRGPLTATRGTAPELIARGVFARGSRELDVVDDPYGPPRLLDPDTGRVRGLYAHGDSFTVGSGFATERPSVGTGRFSTGDARVLGTRFSRVTLTQLEVRIPVAGTSLGGTLTLPAGAGPHPAVAFVAGSGETERAYLPDLSAMLVRAGVAVLTYDKRGIAQSSGRYPGESPTASTIDILARDAAAVARFLTRVPGIDATRVGLAGHSQAGWVMPLAASREPRIRFVISLSGPAVTADEVDLFQTLTGEGVRHDHTLADATAQVEARGPSGVDPIPWLRSLRIPSLWVYGALDQHVPAELSAKRLRALMDSGDDAVTLDVLPGANHALVETKTGLTSEMLRSDRFARWLPSVLRDWLAAHAITRR